MTTDTPELAENPLLRTGGLPRFDQIRPEHVVPGVRHVLKIAEERISDLEQHHTATWTGLLQPLEDLDRPFEYAWGPVSHLFGVMNSPELREAYETILPEVVQFGLRARQSEPIFRTLQAIQSGPEWDTLTEPQRRIIESRIQNAELSGIALQGEQRRRFNEVEQELSKLATDFSNHVLDATKAFSLILTDPADVDGFPPSLLQLTAQSYNQHKHDADPEASPESGPWRISLDPPCVGPFLQHCRRRSLREQVYRAFISRASDGEFDNVPLIPRILKLRHEKAQLLGYNSFAEMSLARKMAPDVAAVDEMQETLRRASWAPAVQDLDDVRELAAQSGQTEPVLHWDVAFWAERLREQRFNYTDEQLRPYFPLERVLDGLFSLCERLFGIRVEQLNGDDVPVWHPDVRYFRVRNEAGEPISGFYLDPYSRPENKRGGAWMDDCLCRRRSGDQLQLPVAHLVCNGTPPVGGKPSLMTFREVETLFHEFGHGLQHMLTTVDYADAAGINGVEWDAVELPSQFMENWCYHRPTLLGMTRHYETGEPLPEELFEKICASRTFRAGSQMLRQLSFGMTDMELHHRLSPDGDETAFDVYRRISEQTAVLPPLEEDRWLCAFQHIFAGGYAAGYYSYKWAEVLSADAFAAFEEAGLDDEETVMKTGRRFRDTVLASGGGRHPMDVFRDFRGREPSPEALLRHSGLKK